MATPPPQQTTPVPPTPQTTPTTAARVSLLTAGEQWSPTMKVQIEPASGRLLLLKQATGSSKERQEQEEECVAMVDLKMVVAEAVLCSEQEATAAGGGGKKADGKEGRNVVNMRVGGKTLMMRVESEATAGELLAAVEGGRASAMLAARKSASGEKSSTNGGGGDSGGGGDRGARRAAAAAAAATLRRRAKDSYKSSINASGCMGDPVRVVGSYTAAPLPPGSPAPPSHPTAPALTTPTLARMANGNSGASPGTAAFVAEQRLLLQQQQRQGMREQEGVEVYAPALRPSREEAKGDDERMEEEGEEGEERGPVGLVEIIEKSQEGPTSPARSLHSQRSSQSSSSNTHNNVLLSVSDSLRSGKRSEELQEGRRMLQAEHRRRTRWPASAESQAQARVCCSVQ